MAPKRKSRPRASSVLNPRRSTDPESVRTRKIARLLKELGPPDLTLGARRSLTAQRYPAAVDIQARHRGKTARELVDKIKLLWEDEARKMELEDEIKY